jgi:hypothetical protein
VNDRIDTFEVFAIGFDAENGDIDLDDVANRSHMSGDMWNCTKPHRLGQFRDIEFAR